MKCVIIGDIGWKDLYHLGDEAMTEVAIEQLQRRGISDITLVAGQPEVAEAFYGCPSVSRIGFLGRWGRDECERVLERVTADLESGELAETDLYGAIAAADFVVIAGGGNLNSSHFNHVYERVAFTRIAKHLRKPLFVTSQTVGPALRDRDTVLVGEILAYASCFGARESTTYEALLQQWGGSPERVALTMDDVVLLDADDAARARVDALVLPERFIVASFTAHQGSISWSSAKYRQRAAELLDELAERHDAQVVLVPHAGPLGGEEPGKDAEGHAEIVSYSRSGRLRELPMIPARDAVEITARALLSVSTRYHPTVFGPQQLTPAGTIATSFYSSVRMRGALSNVGLDAFVVPVVEWDLAADVFSELIERGEEVRAHLETSGRAARDYQEAWWDAIVAAARTGEWLSPGNLPSSASYQPVGAWARTIHDITPVFEMWGMEKTWAKRFRRDREEAWAELDQRRLQYDELRASYEDLQRSREEQRASYEERLREMEARAVRSENRRVVRLVDRVGRVFRRG